MTEFFSSLPPLVYTLLYGTGGFCLVGLLLICWTHEDGEHSVSEQLATLGIPNNRNENVIAVCWFLQGIFGACGLVLSLAVALSHVSASGFFAGYPWYIGFKMMFVGMVAYPVYWICHGLLALVKMLCLFPWPFVRMMGLNLKKKTQKFYFDWQEKRARRRRLRHVRKTTLPDLVAERRRSHIGYDLYEDEDIAAEIEREILHDLNAENKK